MKIDPEKKELLTYLSQVFWGTGQRDRALTLHEKVVELNPQDTQLISNQASMYYELNRKDDAIRMFERILEAAPEAHQIHFSIGTIHLEENRYEDAINSFRNGLPNEPNNSYANKQLGMALHISGAIKEGLEYYEIAFEHAATEVEKVETMVLQGNAYRDLNKTDRAKELYEQALELDPASEIAKKNLETLAKRTIPSWHFNMLADASRNDAYNEAITAAVKPGHHVLDIGTGSGLLSMMAARAGAKKITAVEM